jgi:hypothetical protein
MLQDMLLNSLNSLYIHTTALKRRGATPDFLYTSIPPISCPPEKPSGTMQLATTIRTPSHAGFGKGKLK